MKVSLLVLMFFIGFNCYSQYPKGLPSPSSNGWSKVGYSQADSGMIQIQRDTFYAKYPTVIRYLDGNLWQTLGNGARWTTLKGSSIASIYAGNGLIKVNDSTLRVDTSSIATRLRVQKGIDSLGGVSVKYTDTSSMLSHYFNMTAINSLLALKVNYTDTASMLSKYYNQTAINSRLALKVNYTDTSSMLSGYYRSTNPSGYITSSAITGKVNYTDTSTMLSPYLRSLNASTTYLTQSNAASTYYLQTNPSGYITSSAITGKVNYTDTATMLSAYYNKGVSDGRFVHLTGNETIGGTKTFNTSVNIVATNNGDAYILNGMDYSNTYHIAYLGQTGTNTGYLALADNLGNKATFINGNGYSKINDNLYNPYGVGIGYSSDNGSGAKLQVNGGIYGSSLTTTGNVESTGEVYSNTKLKTSGNVELTVDNTGLYNTASGFTFKAQASNSGWYTPNNLLANAFVKIGGTSSQYLMADGSVTTTSGLFTYNATDPNGSNGSSYTPSNYPVALEMGGFYGGYISVTTSSFTVNGNYRLIELKTGASSVNVTSAATGQDYFIFNSTGSAISISFTLKDLTGATLTTIPANTSYHIFYNGTNYIKI